jgi:hypothetical protein
LATFSEIVKRLFFNYAQYLTSANPIYDQLISSISSLTVYCMKKLGGDEEDENAYIAVEELLEIWARIRMNFLLIF